MFLQHFTLFNGINYLVGVDGVSLFLIVMIAFMTMIAVIGLTEKKGVKKWLKNDKLELDQKKAINHTYMNQADWIKSFNSVFKHLLTKKKF